LTFLILIVFSKVTGSAVVASLKTLHIALTASSAAKRNHPMLSRELKITLAAVVIGILLGARVTGNVQIAA
jgi:hypothetical protein